ncbi:hypothetical protein T4B_3396 [Trichinella pseudospiralis]|uniref:Uncharacterized protein n=2 Tax=Trichinella pseudospiralis TaxID=6337 RepID=A0A0V1J3D7_TRIPS|nr:hypothetical protein T4A_14044 [Trichinella pseudospiralis]KRY90532.1 hypothetical protein T4D_4958 [Trichinella pseudospiralis]KRZ29405.1 hypothetical protein T4B_3396 [Trichinella pseudospiralis]
MVSKFRKVSDFALESIFLTFDNIKNDDKKKQSNIAKLKSKVLFFRIFNIFVLAFICCRLKLFVLL